MLNIDLKPTFSRSVRVAIPSGTGVLEEEFGATFEALDIPEFNNFDLSRPEQTEAFLRRVVIGLDDVIDAEGSPVPFSPALLDRLLAKPWARAGLVRAYVAGFQEEAAKN